VEFEIQEEESTHYDPQELVKKMLNIGMIIKVIMRMIMKAIIGMIIRIIMRMITKAIIV